MNFAGDMRQSGFHLVHQNQAQLTGLYRGRVVGEGTHSALMAAQGAYFKLYEAQARNAAVQDAAGSAP